MQTEALGFLKPRARSLPLSHTSVTSENSFLSEPWIQTVKHLKPIESSVLPAEDVQGDGVTDWQISGSKRWLGGDVKDWQIYGRMGRITTNFCRESWKDINTRGTGWQPLFQVHSCATGSSNCLSSLHRRTTQLTKCTLRRAAILS